MGAPVRLQKAVPRSKEKRRSGAPRGERPSHWACAARRIDVTRAFRRSAPLTFCEGGSPLVSEGMEMPGAPRALREQGRRSFGCLKCESESAVRVGSCHSIPPRFRGGRVGSAYMMDVSVCGEAPPHPARASRDPPSPKRGGIAAGPRAFCSASPCPRRVLTRRSIFSSKERERDLRIVGERSDAVLQPAMSGGTSEF